MLLVDKKRKTIFQTRILIFGSRGQFFLDGSNTYCSEQKIIFFHNSENFEACTFGPLIYKFYLVSDSYITRGSSQEARGLLMMEPDFNE